METFDKHVLGLALPTDPRWVDIASMQLQDILIDHAYCEQKAASACISLIVQYPEKEKLVEALTPVVAEEWSHLPHLRVNMVVPGNIDSPQRGKTHPGEHASERRPLHSAVPTYMELLCEHGRGVSGRVIEL